MTATQLGFTDVGVDPDHWHVLQGHRDDFRFEEGLSPYRELELICASYLDLEDARFQLQAWIGETEYEEGRIPVRLEADRADYDQGTEGGDCAEYWLRIARCDSWGCYKGCHTEDGVWQEFPGTT